MQPCTHLSPAILSADKSLQRSVRHKVPGRRRVGLVPCRARGARVPAGQPAAAEPTDMRFFSVPGSS